MSTRDKDESPVVEHPQADKVAVDRDISDHRRKIIKASAVAIPAIMTLRSGAAAAINSSYQCLNHPGADNENIDLVLGDDVNDPPHDEWVRMEAKPGKIVTYTTGGSANTVTLYGIRKNVTTATWDDWRGWDYYDDQGPVNANSLNNNNFQTAWPMAVEFYCVPGELSGLTCISEQGGAPIDLPAVVETAVNASTTSVFLLAYYNQANGDITFYPMPKEMAVSPITESCMCSIRPVNQLLG